MRSKRSEVGMMCKKTIGKKRSQTRKKKKKKKGSRKAMVPCPILDVSSTWRPGDVVEIFDKISWKIAVLSQILGKNRFLVRPVGSSTEFKVTKVNIRERISWKYSPQDSIEKDCHNFNDAKCNLTSDKNQRSLQKRTNFGSNNADNVIYSVGSCSINKFPLCSSRDRTDNSNGDLSYAESVFRVEEKEEEELDAEIHRLELHAYRCTMEALHASGPLSWEKEELVTNLRLSLHISNDEHLKEIRTLISSNTCCIPGR